MKLNYTTDYVYEDETGISYNIEIETTFDVTPGRPCSFEHPAEGPEINDLTVKVLHIHRIGKEGYNLLDHISKAITSELWGDIGLGLNTDLLERVYADVDEAMWDHA